MQKISKQQVIDVLSAGALGDAFGYPIEFDDWDRIQYQFSGPLLQLPINPVATDDTQMTLFACEGLINSGKFDNNVGMNEETFIEITVESQKLSFLIWYQTQQYSSVPPIAGPQGSLFKSDTEMYYRRAPGNTCLYSLKLHSENAFKPNDSKGCGAVMRSAPYAFLANSLRYSSIWQLSVKSALLTHSHVDGAAPAGALSLLLVYLLTKHFKSELTAVNTVVNLTESVRADNTARLLALAYDKRNEELSPERINELFGEGWTGDEALAIGVYAAFRTSNVWDAIILAANHSGDSDSTASIAGQIAAARFGMNDFDRMQFKKIDLAHIVERTANQLCEVLDVK
jgi:ADP-ribosylglycohydrolase